MIAVEDAWRRWYPIAREKARRLLGGPEDADDVAQEVFVRFWRAGLVTTDPRRASAWLYRTTTRLCVDRLRERRSRERKESVGTAPSPADGPDERLVLRRELVRLADSTPTAELEVAILHRVDRLSQAEVAQVVGTTERTVRRLLTRFDKRLAEFRGGEEP
jgi:RNA polymerase sigma-70 factor (ECF subfamily)